MKVIYIPRYEEYLIFSNGITVKASPVHIDKTASLNDEICLTCKYRYLNKCAKLDRQNTAVNDLSDIVKTNYKLIDGLKEENDKLKFRLKMLTKVCLNSIYGITGTDSIKETKENDSDN